MSVLTSNLIAQKTRMDDLHRVTKLNACGVQVDDIRIMSSVPNIEVCSLSANCIFDLTCFVDCPKMRELYLRKNNIADLHQVLYLTGAPNLQVLRLSENPVCEHPDYRAYTIAALSNLQSFDDEPVSAEERHSAEMAFPDILDDIRNLPMKDAGGGGSPRMSPGYAAPPLAEAPQGGRRANSFEREPASARLPPKQSGFDQQRHQQDSNSNYHNGDDVPIGGLRGGGGGLRRAQSDVVPRHLVQSKQQASPAVGGGGGGAPLNRKSQKPYAAASRDLPALDQASSGGGSQSAKDRAMVLACTGLLDEMSSEGLIAVWDHMKKLGL